MYLTLDDCLSWDIFENSKLIAGKTGINKPVISASVVELYEELDPKYIKEGELLISSLSYINYDIKKLIDFINKITNSKACGFLYFRDENDLTSLEPIINICNNKNFPLIIIKPEWFKFYYNDIIFKIYNYYRNKHRHHLLGSVIDDYLKLPLSDRNINAFIENIGKKLNINIIIADPKLSPLFSYSTDEKGSNIINNLVYYLKDFEIRNSYNVAKKDDITLYIKSSYDDKEFLYYLIVFSSMKNTEVNQEVLNSIIYTINVELNIDIRTKLYLNSDNKIIKILLDNRKKDYENNGKLLEEKIDRMNLIILLKFKYGFNKISKNLMAIIWEIIKSSNKIFGSFIKNSIIGVYNNQIVYLIENNSKKRNIESIINKLNRLISKIDEKIGEHIIVGIAKIDNIKSIRKQYLFLTNSLIRARIIHPKKKVFLLDELTLINSIDMHSIKKEHLTKILMLKEYDEKNGTNYFNTLEAFFLDYNCSVKKTSQSLFLHRNTLSYRMNKIKEILEIDFNKFPYNINYYVLFAIYRLKSSSFEL